MVYFVASLIFNKMTQFISWLAKSGLGNIQLDECCDRSWHHQPGLRCIRFGKCSVHHLVDFSCCCVLLYDGLGSRLLQANRLLGSDASRKESQRSSYRTPSHLFTSAKMWPYPVTYRPRWYTNFFHSVTFHTKPLPKNSSEFMLFTLWTSSCFSIFV